MPDASDGYESTVRIQIWRDGYLKTAEVDGWVCGGIGQATAWSEPLQPHELAEAEAAMVWRVDV